MRRRRHTLQVSTFPFLAVLLCAMGSLILMLLVLDRRARAVARAKERGRQEAVLAQHSQADRDRMLALEQKRAELRQRLETQHAALHANLDSLEADLQRKKQETLQERNRTAELKERLAALRQVLAREQEGFEQEKVRGAAVATKKRQVLSEHEALARELVNLETALADVIAFRKRQAQTYSLVPFLGKSGENRRPVYVECQASQVIVHPERLIASTVSWDGSSQLQAAAQKLAWRLKANSDETKQKPYVLFLVRPDGITTYYNVLAALGVRNIDSAYELIDADWALDFGEADGHAPAQPWTADPKTPAPATLAGALPRSPKITAIPVRGMAQNGADSFSGGGSADGHIAAKPQYGTGTSDGAGSQTGTGYASGGAARPTAGGGGLLSSTAGDQAGNGFARGGTAQANSGGGGASLSGSTGGSNPGTYGREPSGRGYQAGDGSGSPGVANAVPGGVRGGNGFGSPDGQIPGASGSRGQVGGQGPNSLGDLLNPTGAQPRGSENRNGGMATTGQSSGSLSAPGAGVPLPGPAGSGGPRTNTGDSSVAFTESGQRSGGGSQGEQRLLPLPGQSGQPGTAGSSQMAATSGNSAGGSAGPDASNGTVNNGAGGYGGVGSGLPSLGPPGESTSVGGGARSPNPDAANMSSNGGAGAAGAVGAGSPNPPAAGEAVNNSLAGPTGAEAPPPGAGAAQQPALGQAVVVAPGADRRANANPGAAGGGSGGDPNSGRSSGGGGGDPGDGAGGSSVGGMPLPDPLAGLTPRSKRPPPPVSFRAEGNRDLPIVIECRANEVVITATNKHWQVTDLERNGAAQVAFSSAVQQWIARRQATLFEGQTPYRPFVRFRVTSDGLRTYYAAYPLLEKLDLPMRRENVDSRPAPAPGVRPE